MIVCAPFRPNAEWFYKLNVLASDKCKIMAGKLTKVAPDAPSRVSEWPVMLFHIPPRHSGRRQPLDRLPETWTGNRAWGPGWFTTGIWQAGNANRPLIQRVARQVRAAVRVRCALARWTARARRTVKEGSKAAPSPAPSAASSAARRPAPSAAPSPAPSAAPSPAPSPAPGAAIGGKQAPATAVEPPPSPAAQEQASTWQVNAVVVKGVQPSRLAAVVASTPPSRPATAQPSHRTTAPASHRSTAPASHRKQASKSASIVKRTVKSTTTTKTRVGASDQHNIRMRQLSLSGSGEFIHVAAAAGTYSSRERSPIRTAECRVP